MAKQFVTIELDAPEGYELVGYRPPHPDEPWLNSSGGVCSTAPSDFPSLKLNRIILRKLWQPPSWFPDGCWVFKDTSGNWYATDKEPGTNVVGHCFPAWSHSVLLPVGCLACLAGDTFAPPPVDKIQVRHNS